MLEWVVIGVQLLVPVYLLVGCALATWGLWEDEEAMKGTAPRLDWLAALYVVAMVFLWPLDVFSIFDALAGVGEEE